MVLLIAGTAVFTLGADMSMLVIGQKVGSALTRSKKIWLIAFVSFVIGVIVTIAEPDLQILAQQVPDIENTVMIVSVSVGVGVFSSPWRCSASCSESVCPYCSASVMSRCLPSRSCSCRRVSGPFPSTRAASPRGRLPCRLSCPLGVGVAAVRSDRKSGDDSFGLVALGSVGPVLAVLVLGIVYKAEGGEYAVEEIVIPGTTQDAFLAYGRGLGEYALEVLRALSPIAAFFVLFQLFTRLFPAVSSSR